MDRDWRKGHVAERRQKLSVLVWVREIGAKWRSLCIGSADHDAVSRETELHQAWCVVRTWAFLVCTLALLGYGQTNVSTRFGCTVYAITAQPEVWVWLDALYFSGFLCEEGIQCFISNGYRSIIGLRILSFVFLAVGHHWDEEVLLLSWHLDPSGTSRWWVAYDIHMAQLFLKHTKHTVILFQATLLSTVNTGSKLLS